METLKYLIILLFLLSFTGGNKVCFSAIVFINKGRKAGDYVPAWAKNLLLKKNTKIKSDPAIGKAAERSASIAQESLDFSRQSYNASQARQAEQDAIANQVTNQQLKVSQIQQEWAEQDRNRDQNIVNPLRDQQILDAQNYATQARQDSAADAAAASIETAMSNQQAAMERQQMARGVDPSSGNSTEIDRNSALATAKASASAQNAARDSVRSTAQAMQANVINTNSGLASQSLAAMNSGINAGSMALQNTSANNSQAASNYNIMSSGFGSALQGYGQSASILNTQKQNEIAEQQANAQASSSAMSGLGSIAGMAMMFSSKDYKENKEELADGAGLEMIRKMPVGKWDYKDGMGDGGHHIGAYYEDYSSATGDSNPLKAIPVVDAIGISMKAIQDLDKKIDKAIGNGSPKKEKVVSNG